MIDSPPMLSRMVIRYRASAGGTVSSAAGFDIKVKEKKMTIHSGRSRGTAYRIGYCEREKKKRYYFSRSHGGQDAANRPKTLTRLGRFSSASWLMATSLPRASEASLMAGVKAMRTSFFSPDAFHKSSVTYLYSMVKPLESIFVILAFRGGWVSCLLLCRTRAIMDSYESVRGFWARSRFCSLQ
jgi:hypothetical protein